MKVVFMGTPIWASFYLEAIRRGGGEIPLVVTQPDRPRGRSKKPKPPPVKEKATEMDLQIHQPENINVPESYNTIEAVEPDFFLVVAFGQILDERLLQIPAVDPLNVHYSLLPKLRGPAPIQHALMRGYDTTGVTLQRMAPEVDAGEIFAQTDVPIEDDDNADTLCRKLTDEGLQMVAQTLEPIYNGEIDPVPQDDSAATYAPRITKSHAMLDFSRTAENLRNQIRALAPRPGAYCLIDDRRLKVLKAEVVRGFETAEGNPGEIVEIYKGSGPVVQTGQGALRFLRVQPAGSRDMDAAAWLRGARLEPGLRLVGRVDK